MAKLLLAALFCLAAHAAAAAEPSRPPEQGFGCVWKPFESKEQGIHLLSGKLAESSPNSFNLVHRREFVDDGRTVVGVAVLDRDSIDRSLLP